MQITATGRQCRLQEGFKLRVGFLACAKIDKNFLLLNFLLVSDLPTIYGSDVTYASLGDSATIECSVVAFPEPKVAFWRSSLERVPIVK